MFVLDWLKKLKIKRLLDSDTVHLYPNTRSCVRKDMSKVQPHQMPPLMVRKAAWRR
ncbi:hypothetical protein ACQ9LF_02065 [Anaerohalosphaeraceae bacterium U12dextr]